MSMIKRNTNEQRESIIAMALETPEGRTALAQAMVEPIKTSLMYQAIGRKLLMVDELPQGALARYERDVAVKSYVIPKRGAVPAEARLGPDRCAARRGDVQTGGSADSGRDREYELFSVSGMRDALGYFRAWRGAA